MVTPLMQPDPLALLNAARELDAADRALVDLWCVRRLTDERLEQLSGVRAERLQMRRERIARRLAELQGLDADQVRDALASLAGMAPAPAGEPSSHPDSPAPTATEHVARLGTTPQSAAATSTTPDGTGAPDPPPATPGPVAAVPGSGATPGLLLGPAATQHDVRQQAGLPLGPAAVRRDVQQRTGLLLGPAAALTSPASVPLPAPGARRRRRALSGVVAALCVALGAVAFAAQRADAQPAPAVTAGATRASRPARADPHTGSVPVARGRRAAAHPGR